MEPWSYPLRRGAASVLVWLEFALCLAVIAVAGSRLCHYGDAIADKAGWTGSWAGVVLLATVTSMPELVTGISAVTVAQAPDIAVGDVFGSCVFNLLLIVLLDALLPGDSIFSRVDAGHVIAAALGVLLIGFAGFAVLLGTGGRMPPAHLWAVSPIIVVLYLGAMRVLFQYQRAELKQRAQQLARQPAITLQRAILGYAGAAAAVVAAGVWLPVVAKQICELTGLEQSFVGTLLVAAATSAPEAAVAFAALRLRALDMAMAGLLGSNLFDVFILAVDDAFYRGGPLLGAVSPAHALTTLSAVMMSALVIVGVMLRASSRVLHTVGLASAGLLVLYVLNAALVFLHG